MRIPTVKEIAKGIVDDIENREDELEQLLKQDIFSSREEPKNTTFIVARRWNSWYPSYFDVAGGGSYLILTGKAHPDDKSEPPKKPKVILVDPGYGFLTIVRSLGINAEDIDTVIITHFHPDHMNGIFEYMNLRVETGKTTSIYMNPTTFAALGRSGSGNIDISELPPSSAITLAEYQKHSKMYERIIVRAVQTHHREITNTSHPIGLIFEIEQCKSPLFDEEPITKNIGIIGDTDAYHTHLESYAEKFHKCDVLVLHLGTFAPKPKGRPGKHLYLMGARDLLNELKVERRRSEIRVNQLVLISEFGMEHAALDQLYKAVSEKLEVKPCQAILGYFIERKDCTEDSRTSLAGVAYAHWFYHWLVRPLAYEDASALLIALGLKGMLCAPEECERLLPESLDNDVTDRDIMLGMLIKSINQKCEEAKDTSKQLLSWTKRLLADAILARVDVYDDEKSIKSSIGRQQKRFMDAIGELEKIARGALSRHLWRVIHVLTFDEVQALRERIRRDLKEVVDTSIMDLDRTRTYGSEKFHFHDVLLYSIIVINYLKMVVDEMWPEIEDMISKIPDRNEPMLKRIENFFGRENDDWCTVFATDIGCEVIVGDKILMKTFDGRELEPREVESEYDAVERRIRYISKPD